MAQFSAVVVALDKARAQAADLKKRIRLALKWLDVAEQKVNDNPANGPGSPDVPGLFELRNGMVALRRPLKKKARKT